MQKKIGGKITKELPAKVASFIRVAGKIAEKTGMSMYLVGGIVRDLLIGRQSKDIDIMVEGDAIAVAASMSKILGSKPTIHKRFGTATFKLGEYRIDLATCRSETYNHPGALPSIKPGSIKEDLFRRDFTVNAMAACINTSRFGAIIDLYGGQKDLEKKLIRILHDRSFTDDATRIMRAVRYEQRLGFKLEPKTARILRRDLDMLDMISGDRLRHEVILWLEELQSGKILGRAFKLGILAKLHPALQWDRHTAKAFRDAAAIPGNLHPIQLGFAILIYNLNKEQLGELLNRLNIRGGELEEIARHTLSLRSNLTLFDRKSMKPSEIYLKLKGFNGSAVRANHLLSTSENVRSNLELYLAKLHRVKTLLNGEDLAKLGVPRGRKMGIILEKLLIARLDGKIKSRPDEERMALQFMRDSKSWRM